MSRLAKALAVFSAAAVGGVLACGQAQPGPTAAPAASTEPVSPPNSAPPADRLILGIEYAFPQAAEPFSDSGATLAKPYPELGRWSTVQPEADSAFDWTRVDAFVRAFQEAGFPHLNLMMSAWSDWANVDPPRLPMHRGDSWLKPEHEPDFAAYVQAYVERYDLDGQDDMPGLRYPVRLYGLEPEYSSYVAGDADSYLRLLELAYPAVKRADPQTQLMAAGLLLATVFDGYPSPEEAAARLADSDERVFDKSPADIAWLLDHPELFDIVDFHSLTDSTEILPTVAWLRQEMARRGYERPIWVGDTWGGSTLAGYGPVACPAGPRAALLSHPATEADRCQVAAALAALRGNDDPGHEEALRWIRAESAAGTVRKVAIAAGAGLMGINMGNVEDWEVLMLSAGGAGTSPWQGMMDRHLLTRAFQGYRPSFYALQQIAALIRAYAAVTRLDLGDPRLYVYRFELETGEGVYVAWADNGLWLPGDEAPLRRVEIPFAGSGEILAEWTVTEGDTPRRETLSFESDFLPIDLGPVPAFLREAP